MEIPKEYYNNSTIYGRCLKPFLSYNEGDILGISVAYNTLIIESYAHPDLKDIDISMLMIDCDINKKVNMYLLLQEI
jgi:hypothetical protein